MARTAVHCPPRRPVVPCCPSGAPAGWGSVKAPGRRTGRDVGFEGSGGRVRREWGIGEYRTRGVLFTFPSPTYDLLRSFSLKTHLLLTYWCLLPPLVTRWRAPWRKGLWFTLVQTGLFVVVTDPVPPPVKRGRPTESGSTRSGSYPTIPGSLFVTQQRPSTGHDGGDENPTHRDSVTTGETRCPEKGLCPPRIPRKVHGRQTLSLPVPDRPTKEVKLFDTGERFTRSLVLEK